MNPRWHIRNACLECMGYNRNDVKTCASTGCWNWPYRMADSVDRSDIEKEGRFDLS